MRRFNAAMQVVFGIVGFIGFMGMCIVNDNEPNWFKVLMISFILFLIGFISCVFFDDPARFVKYLVGSLIVMLALVYEFCHELKKCMKSANKYKKHYGTYKKTYRRASDQYYVNHSSYYNDKEYDYTFDE